MSDTTTRGVRVQVESRYLDERSSPAERYFLFSYQVRITNRSEETVQLVSRRWIITDADGHVERVEGPGVVGVQPVLPPGESFEYTSFCPLQTPVGTMEGGYLLRTPDGEAFEAGILPFSLEVPGVVN